jgi:hypothetical protein
MCYREPDAAQALTAMQARDFEQTPKPGNHNGGNKYCEDKSEYEASGSVGRQDAGDQEKSNRAAGSAAGAPNQVLASCHGARSYRGGARVRMPMAASAAGSIRGESEDNQWITPPFRTAAAALVINPQ